MMSDQILIDCPFQVVPPNSEIHGEILWDLQEDPESVTLNLGWWTSGKGTRDEEIIDSIDLGGERIGKRRFSFKMPASPYSFSGKLVSVEWGLECSVKKGDARAIHNLVLSPLEDEIDISGKSYESQTKSISVRPG